MQYTSEEIELLRRLKEKGLSKEESFKKLDNFRNAKIDKQEKTSIDSLKASSLKKGLQVAQEFSKPRGIKESFMAAIEKEPASISLLGGVARTLTGAAQLAERGVTKLAAGTGRLLGQEEFAESVEEERPIKGFLEKAQEALEEENQTLAGMIGEQIPGFLVGGEAAVLSRKLTQSIGEKILPKILQKALPALTGAAELAGFTAAERPITEQRLPTKEELATSASVGAAIPVAGKFLDLSRKFIGKTVPESLIKSGIGLTKKQKTIVSQKAGKTAEEFLVNRKIVGDQGEIVSRLTDVVNKARQQKLSNLAAIPKRIKNLQAEQLADDIIKLNTGKSGQEKVVKEANRILSELKSREGALLGDIDKLKTLFDREGTSVFKAVGTKETARAKGLVKSRAVVQKQIEDQASKLGITNIKELNKEILTAKEIQNAVLDNLEEGKRGLLSLTDVIVATGAGAGAISGGLTPIEAIGIVLGKKVIGSPTFKLKLAQGLSKLAPAERGFIIKLMTGERSFTGTKKEITTANKLKNAIKKIKKSELDELKKAQDELIKSRQRAIEAIELKEKGFTSGEGFITRPIETRPERMLESPLGSAEKPIITPQPL